VREALAGAAGRGEAVLARQRWRLFFLACAELFGFAGGSEWFVTHVRMAPRAGSAT
jgi:cyclopropane-fatty-acyl-phospholipid synthase